MPTANIPEWGWYHFQLIESSTRKLKRIANHTGTNFDEFETTCEALLDAAETDEHALAATIRRSIDVRAYTHLLSTNLEFRKRDPLPHILETAIKKARWPMSKLALAQLINAYFFRFNSLNATSIRAFRELIEEAYKSKTLHTGDGFLSEIQRNITWLVQPLAPQEVAERAKLNNVPLENYLLNIGLSSVLESSFVASCRNQYFISALQSIPVGAHDPLLLEIAKPGIVNSSFDDSRLMGHRVLEILIDRSPKGAASKSWRDLVMKIAGDPRVSRTAQNFQKWWQLLGEDRVEKVSGWLSQIDLQIFLDILEVNARGNSDVQRMFPPRKKFMEGLLSQGLVKRSRLFLSKDAVEHLKVRYRNDQIPEYAEVDQKTSIIYLELPEDIHLLEGTHSFKIKVLDALPDKKSLIDYSRKKYSDSYLRIHWIQHYLREGKSRRYQSGHLDLTHTGPISWQTRVIGYLRDRGIQVSASELFTKDHYVLYKDKLGSRF